MVNRFSHLSRECFLYNSSTVEASQSNHTNKTLPKGGESRTRLTYSQLLSEDRPLPQGRAVPAPVAELVLALVDAQLGALADDDDGVRATLAEGPLTGCQSWYVVADDVGAQGHHGGQRPAGMTIVKRLYQNSLLEKCGEHSLLKQKGDPNLMDGYNFY